MSSSSSTTAMTGGLNKRVTFTVTYCYGPSGRPRKAALNLAV
jgi:hypothetical protein